MSAAPDHRIGHQSALFEFEQAADVRAELLDYVRSLGFLAFQHLIRDLLQHMGYHDVKLLGRTAWRGPRRNPGAELEAYSQTGVSRSKILVQVKQYRRSVARAFVDQLRGTLLTNAAGAGIVIATSPIAPAARRAATDARVAGIAPIRLIDSEELLDLLFTHRIGVWHDVSTGGSDTNDGPWGIDFDYFAGLQSAFDRPVPGTRRVETDALQPVVPVLEQHITYEKGGEMTWRTHVLAAIASVWLLTLVPSAISAETLGAPLVAVTFGALLPDLDASRSKLASLTVGGVQPFAPLSAILHRELGHRGFLHSLAGLATVGLIAFSLTPLVGWLVPTAFVLGYASHIALDACTVTGVRLLFPKRTSYHLLPRRLRFVTGGPWEEVLLVLFGSLALALLIGQLLAGIAVAVPAVVRPTPRLVFVRSPS